MLIMIIEGILGAFIANFKTKDHPILTFFLKGALIGLTGFFLGLIYGYFTYGYFISIRDIFLVFGLSQLIGFICSVVFIIIDFIFPDKDRPNIND